MSTRQLPVQSTTGLVTFTLKVDGQVLGRSYGVKNITVSREIGRIPKATLVLTDGDPAAGDFPRSNEPTFLPGKPLEITVGYDGTEETVFKGLIVRHALRIRADRAPELTVEARHAAVKATLTRRCRYFTDQKDSDVFESLLGEYGLTPDAPATAETHAGLVQYHATDWDFLLTRAEANGRLVLVGDETVAFAAPDFSPAPTLELTYGATMLEFDAELDARSQPESVDAQAWQPADQSQLDAPAAEPGLPEAGNLPATDLAAALGGSEMLRHGGPLPQPDLQAWADGRLQRRRLAKVRGRVRFRGCKALKLGELISLAGVGDRFNGTVLVAGVRHEISGGLWTTDVQFGLPPLPGWEETGPDALAAPAAGGLTPPARGLHVGVVTALEDPDGGFRVKVRMPAVSTDAEGVWARMALPDAGAGRGTFFRPEVGDEVVVGFFDDDPRFPVVLGGLHSAAKAAPLTPADANPKKGIFTRENLKLLFDDEQKSVTLETPAGKKITLDEAAGTVRLEDENRNKLTLDATGVTVESGGNLTLKAASGLLSLEAAQLSLSANAALAVKATGALQLESSGVATLKGAVVMIN
jgi:Rhs element Vgr protein